MKWIASTILIASLAWLPTISEARGTRIDPDLSKAERLVNQSYHRVRLARRKAPNGYGGHEARAERLLKQASRELSEAAIFRAYNSRSRTAAVDHTAGKHSAT